MANHSLQIYRLIFCAFMDENVNHVHLYCRFHLNRDSHWFLKEECLMHSNFFIYMYLLKSWIGWLYSHFTTMVVPKLHENCLVVIEYNCALIASWRYWKGKSSTFFNTCSMWTAHRYFPFTASFSTLSRYNCSVRQHLVLFPLDLVFTLNCSSAKWVLRYMPKKVKFAMMWYTMMFLDKFASNKIFVTP